MVVIRLILPRRQPGRAVPGQPRAAFGPTVLRGGATGADGTPYTVTNTQEGFDATLDTIDAQWFDLLIKHGLNKI